MNAPRVRRALVSVHDKHGVVELCRTLATLGVEILSSGGTARLLEQHEIPVRKVADHTGFPELLGGRVKTLHPRIHAGILAVRSDPAHMADLERSDIPPIDLVVVNLYPFERTAADPANGPAEIVEMIDIGGPTLVRAAAKNFADVGVVVDPADYATVADELRRDGGLAPATRRRLAVRAFAHTSAYDAAVHGWLAASEAVADGGAAAPFPARLAPEFLKVQDLRYGENPHQRAAFYRDPLAAPPSLAAARQLQGKELSFNNILDFDAALDLAVDLRPGACAIIKHGNPCGVALASDAATAFRRALECDPQSAFGGVLAFNLGLDASTAAAVAEQFFEGVIAPEFDAEAREILSRKKGLRLLEVGALSEFRRSGWDLRRVSGGLLVQDWDELGPGLTDAHVASRRPPSDAERQALEFAWIVAKHVKSNAIVYARDERTVGIGAGQMSRVDSARFGMQKARLPLAGAVMASDAFFPFRDGLDVGAEAGITAVVQPGGSVRDAEVIAAADEHDMAMLFTGRRHFRH
ncbi:MAG TPA: bifunctional phosphoribosylaminoimidazolecarboxamide formyltransferase/IMP cyclohydrolase [Candidatus Polarisedimenticolaceae bacterium]|nr:bifunctional phosphoribosylaminoimidazolecarboxamide formyltransferase/IMP cyclohydrolase [Candidatus Polarisedimenticolaceae bacterium]